MTSTPLPADFRAALGDAEELLVTSRSGVREVTVPMSFALSASGALHLMTSALSRKARRWERDPWVRLTVPGGSLSVEGTVRRISADDLEESARVAVLDRFATSGAATPEALRELLAAGTHLLLRVDPPPS